MTLLESDQLSVELAGRSVLSQVSLALHPGEVLGLIGPNGAGKTTFLRACVGLLPPSAGTVRFGERPVETWDRTLLARDLAYLPQAAEVHWPLPVRDVVALGRLPHQTGWGRDPEGEDAVAEAMRLGDVEDLAGRIATELSGGERARVMLARALAGRPKVLLADEPVAGLDPYHRLEMMECLTVLAGRGMGVAVVLHDLTLAGRFCDRVALFDHGRLVANGDPRTEMTAARLAEIYRVEALTGEQGDRFFVVPWRRLEEGRSESAEGGKAR